MKEILPLFGNFIIPYLIIVYLGKKVLRYLSGDFVFRIFFCILKCNLIFIIMDILNWLYLRKEQLIRTTANNPETDLIAVGADATFAKRGDKYQTYAMPIKDLSVAGDVANTGSYILDLGDTNIVTVTTQKGIIDIMGMGSGTTTPDPSYANPEVIYINNPELDLTLANRENIYIQYSIYYSPVSDDNVKPYVLATTAPSGLELSIFNANSAVAGGNNWLGAFYLYYELYTI